MILSWLAKSLVYLLGWKVKKTPLAHSTVTKGVIVFGPHTSNWDAFYGLLGIYARKDLLRQFSFRFAIKKEALFFPIGLLLRSLGAVPIARQYKGFQRQSKLATQHLADLLQQKDNVFIIISPEGTRQYAKRWHKGFYHVAQQANVPVIALYLDYAQKELGVGPTFYPPHKDPDKLIAELQSFYGTKKGKYPAQGICAVQKAAL